MSKKTDVLVIGSGLAGLMAALAAARKKARVHVLSEGMGCLAISGGNIDLLGYDAKGHRLLNPYDGMESLAADHPYMLLGPDKVREAMEALEAALGAQGLEMKRAADEQGMPRNASLPTIMGTFKPSYIYPAAWDLEAMEKAQKVLVLSVRGFRDCRPQLIISQLRRYKGWEDREYAPAVLPAPFSEEGRSITALDLAHVADRKDGAAWMAESLKGLGKNFDVALMPPMLGSRCDSSIRKNIVETLGCPYVEMIAIPPAVAGLRIRDALMRSLHELDVEFFENAEVTGGQIRDGKCVAIVSRSTRREVTHEARAVVVATGGILGGGVILSPGSARERIFGTPLPVPENVDDWTQPEIFGQHLVSRLGIAAGKDLKAAAKDMPDNVFYAGRTLGGYDYAAEKSGHGVAAATGWQAGNLAAAMAQNRDEEQLEHGAEK